MDLEENPERQEQWNTSYALLVPGGIAVGVVTEGASEIHSHMVPFFATRRADPLALLAELLETVKDVYSLRDLPPGWNGGDVEASDFNAIENAASWVVRMYWDALGTGKGWYKPHVTVDEDGDIMFEWWNGNKALTIYVSGDSVSYIKGWGLDIENEMEDGEATTSESRSSLWAWLMN
jgi:hypothetical protein